MDSNVPSWVTENTLDTSSIPSDSGSFSLKHAVASAVLGASLTLAGQPTEAAEVTGQMNAMREACIAQTRIKSANLLKLVETKRAAGEMDKVAKLEAKFTEVVESCVDLAKADERIAKADERIASETAKGKELDAKKSELDAKKSELDAKKSELDAKLVTLNLIEKTGEEISTELKKRIQIIDDFWNGKISNSEYQASLAQLPQFLERAFAWLASARKILTDEKSVMVHNNLEKSIQKLISRVPVTSTQKVAQK